MVSLCYIEYNFIIYSFLGWIIEQLYSYITVEHFKREGFLYGPIKPMYGFSITIIVCLFNFYNFSSVNKILICLIVPAAVEYTSGYLLKKVFKKQYWSYENCRFNIKGLICPEFCLYWVILTLTALKLIIPFTDYMYDRFNFVIVGFSLIFIISSIVDFFYTLRSYAY